MLRLLHLLPKHTVRSTSNLTRLATALTNHSQLQIQHVCAPRCSLRDHSPAIFSDPDQTHITFMSAQPPPGLSRTFYKRELPCPPAVAFSSPEGQIIFSRALSNGTLNNFFKLIEQFRTQDEPAYCGLASVSMVLNALSIDPRRAWKGPWRFFHEQMLDCCHPLEQIKEEGITLNQAACLARCNGADVTTYPYGDVSLDQFRDMVIDSCSSGKHHLIVSYSRKSFLQTGDGHFSPIGGYSAEHDMVLILDTARFKYPPHWVKVEDLYYAMEPLDPTTRKPRGFMRLGLKPLLESVLFTLDLRHAEWEGVFQYIEKSLPKVVSTAALSALPSTTTTATATTTTSKGNYVDAGLVGENILHAVAALAPRDGLVKFLSIRSIEKCDPNGVCTQTSSINTLLHELRSMQLYRVVHALIDTEKTAGNDIETTHQDGSGNSSSSSGNGNGDAVPGALLAERLTVLLLLASDKITLSLASLDKEYTGMDALVVAKEEIESLLDTSKYAVVHHEIRYLLDQYKELPTMKAALVHTHDEAL